MSTDSHYIPLRKCLKNLVFVSQNCVLEELCERLHTDPVTGLAPDEAKAVLKMTGPNMLTPPKKKSELFKYIYTLFHGLSKTFYFYRN